MIISITFAAALVCQGAPPPAAPPPPPPGSLAAALQAPRTPRPESTTPAAPAPPKTVAELFRERAAREAAAKTAESQPTPPVDGEYHCRRTATSVTCGTDEEAMKRTEEAAKAQLDRLLNPQN